MVVQWMCLVGMSKMSPSGEHFNVAPNCLAVTKETGANSK